MNVFCFSFFKLQQKISVLKNIYLFGISIGESFIFLATAQRSWPWLSGNVDGLRSQRFHFYIQFSLWHNTSTGLSVDQVTNVCKVGILS